VCDVVGIADLSVLTVGDLEALQGQLQRYSGLTRLRYLEWTPSEISLPILL
jgi:hypothetical protein